MAHAAEAFVLIARSRIDVNANAGERTGEGFRGDTNAIRKSCNLVKLGWILRGAFKVRGSL